MATFQFSNDRVIDLDFCGKIRKQLSVDADLMKRFQKAGNCIVNKNVDISKNSDPDVLDDMCDCIMDAIDTILGDGEADKILELKPGYAVFDAIDVIQYIFREINAGVDGLADIYGKHTEAQPMNRAQRRAARRQ